MRLSHFINFKAHHTYAAICEICEKGGNHYAYGTDRKNEYSEIHDFCNDHAEEYKNIYKTKVRKLKLEKIQNLSND
jgi:hypothetical protein